MQNRTLASPSSLTTAWGGFLPVPLAAGILQERAGDMWCDWSYPGDWCTVTVGLSVVIARRTSGSPQNDYQEPILRLVGTNGLVWPKPRMVMALAGTRSRTISLPTACAQQSERPVSPRGVPDVRGMAHVR